VSLNILFVLLINMATILSKVGNYLDYHTKFIFSHELHKSSRNSDPKIRVHSWFLWLDCS